MTCDRGRILGYRDGALEAGERRTMEAHLASCVACRAELASQRQRQAELEHALTSLEPDRADIPDSKAALSAVRQAATSSARARIDLTQRSVQLNTMRQAVRRFRPLAIGAAAVACIAILFAFAPARQAAAQFLSVFRVKRFEVVTVTSDRVTQLQTLEGLLGSGLLGEPTMLREPGQPVTVADAAEASRVGGFDVRTPSEVPDTAVPTEFEVATGPHLRLDVPTETVAAALAAAGIEDVTLPAMDSFTLDVDVPAVAVQTYRIGDSRMQVIQAPSPTIVLPPGVPPASLGKAFLELAGMAPDQAARMAAEIDWTSTLVIPVPESLADFTRVDVGGASGVLLHSSPEEGPAEAMVMWERDGILNAVGGSRVSDAALLRTAASLR